MGGLKSISALAREGLKEDTPDAFALLNALSSNEDQLGELELAIQKAGHPVKGTKTWLKDNRAVVKPWREAAKQA
jgi:glycine betaine/proline transport system substrate-binding protein